VRPRVIPARHRGVSRARRHGWLLEKQRNTLLCWVLVLVARPRVRFGEAEGVKTFAAQVTPSQFTRDRT